MRRLVLMTIVILMFCGCAKPVQLPVEVQEIDAALRQRGVAATHDCKCWSVRVPPEVAGEEVIHTFFWSSSSGSYRRNDYVRYCTISVDTDGVVYVRPTFRMDTERSRNWSTTVGKIGGPLSEDVRRNFYNRRSNAPVRTNDWLKEVLLKNIRDPRFDEWMKELD